MVQMHNNIAIKVQNLTKIYHLYDKRQSEKKKHERFKKELEKCNEKGVEISQECKEYFKKRFE